MAEEFSFQAFTALLVVVAATLVRYVIGRTRRNPRCELNEPRLAALDRLVLTPSHTLHLVRVGGEQFVVATHSGGCSVLRSLPLGQESGAHMEAKEVV